MLRGTIQEWKPAHLPDELLATPVPSNIVQLAPSKLRKYAVAEPIIPPPIIAMRFGSLSCAVASLIDAIAS
jgi:hypothetical protein